MKFRKSLLAAAAVAAASLAQTGAMGAASTASAAPPKAIAAVTAARPAAATPPLGHWGTASAVPGLSALAANGASWVTGLACAPSSGDCLTGGEFTDAHGRSQGWVATGHDGTWTNAVALPGYTPSGSSSSLVNAVACAAGNYCVAVGAISDQNGSHAVVAIENRGHWSPEMTVPGAGGFSNSQALAASCVSPGNCTTSGWYQDASNQFQAFVSQEVNGSWPLGLQTFPNLAALNTGGNAQISSMSCPAFQQCLAAGDFTLPNGEPEGFVVAEKDGRWFTAQPVDTFILSPTTAQSVACPTAGSSCALAGTGTDGQGRQQAYTLKAGFPGLQLSDFLPGIRDLNLGGAALPRSVSCSTEDNCVTGGYYTDQTGNLQPFLAEETNGTWGNAFEVPGIFDLSIGGGQIQSVSCPSPRNCSASGFYPDMNDKHQVFTVDEVNGTWGSAVKLPGTSGQGLGAGAFVSCWAPGSCAATGAYTTTAGLRATTDRETPGASATLATSAPTVNFGQEQAAKLAVTVKPQTGGTPAGTVTIKAGTATLTTVPLTAAKVIFTLPAKQLKPGTYQLTASYASSNGYHSVTSAGLKLTVAPPASAVALTLSATKVRAGHEQSEHLSIKVTSPAGGTPAGKVTIRAGTVVLATVTLKSGQVTWIMPASRLRPGTYQLTASYASSNGYQPANSAKKQLTVTK